MIGLLAKILARPAVADWLIRRAMRTPYFHIHSDDGIVYMERYWLFNPYVTENDGAVRRWGDWLPSIRIHRIMRADQGQHLHDHPWNARTFILRGWYYETRKMRTDIRRPRGWFGGVENYARIPGDTVTLKFGEFHHITTVSEGGVWTLFVTGKKRGTWGFLVDGFKVPWREYLGISPAHPSGDIAAHADVCEHCNSKRPRHDLDCPIAVSAHAQQAAAAPSDAKDANSLSELTTVNCPTCADKHGQCDDCDGQGKVIVSRTDLARAYVDHADSEGGHHD